MPIGIRYHRLELLGADAALHALDNQVLAVPPQALLDLQILSERYYRHEEALLRLGYFERRQFRLQNHIVTPETLAQFTKLAKRTPFTERVWRASAFENETNLIRVTAWHGDMQRWERLLASFDSPGHP